MWSNFPFPVFLQRKQYFPIPLFLRLRLQRLEADGRRDGHAVESVVHVHGEAGACAGERRAEEACDVANLRSRESLRRGCVLLRVVDHRADETNRLRRAASKRSGGDGVDAHAVLLASLPREHARVRLERRFCGAHATSVSGHDAFGGEVREADDGSSRVHDGRESLRHGHHGVRRRGDCGEVSSAARLEQRLGHLRSVGEAVHDDVDGSEVRLDLVRTLGDCESGVRNVPLVLRDIRGNILGRVVDGIHGVDGCKLHERSVGEFARLVKLSTSQRRFEDVECRHPRSQNDFTSRLCERLGDGPSVSLVVGDTCDERFLSTQVDGKRGVGCCGGRRRG
mmetsp:Transcript_16053/g.40853  ORF Transcript_16053/g.40853 Transcript_16053/m.40853 type:complete len:338 (+) Transcript_16053:2292-3305(+)